MKTKLFFIGMLAIIGLSANAQWQTTNGPFSGSTILTLYANSSHIFCGTESGGAFIYNGSTWSSINTGMTGSAPTITCMTGNGTDLYCTSGGLGLNSRVYLSTNNGSTWDSINTGLNNCAQSIVVSGTNLYAGTYGGGTTGGVFESTNDGSSWTALVTGYGFGSGGVHALDINGSHIIACVYGGTQVSLNNGVSWTWPVIGSGGYISYSIARSGTNVFVGTEQGVYLTTDATDDTIYTAINSSMPGNCTIYSIIIDGSNIFAGSDSGVFVTYNNGGLWTSINTGLPVKDIYSLAIYGTDLYAGTGTQGVWKRPLSEIESGINNLSYQNTEVSIYPNPFSNKASVKILTSNTVSNGELKMFDLQGQEVRMITNIDGQEITIDRNGLSNGIYFIRLLENNKTIWSGKIVITD